MAEASPSRQLDALTTDADSLYVIRVHARWDGTNVVATASWLMLAQLRLSDYPDILSTRLAEAPNDVLLLRLEQDGAAAADKAGVCARHRARSESAPDDADLTYVAARCITDARARTQAFLDGHQRWPTSGWFAQAVGYTYLDAGQWQQAAEALDQAFRALRPPAEHLVVDLARLHRLIDANPRPAIARLAPGSAYLRYLVSLDSGQGLDSPTQLAYLELARGHLDKALELARADSEVEARVLRLAAASDGAPAELVSRALALPTEAGLDDQTRWASIGLAARMGRDFTPLVSSKQSWPREYVDTLLGFLARARSGKNLSAAEGSLKRLPLEVRGEGYVLGVITLRGRAPAAWRHAAKQLLFITERPYFN